MAARFSRDGQLDSGNFETDGFVTVQLPHGGIKVGRVIVQADHKVLIATTAKMDPLFWQERAARVRREGYGSFIETVLTPRWFTPDFAKRSPEIMQRVKLVACDLDPHGVLKDELEARAATLGIAFQFLRRWRSAKSRYCCQSYAVVSCLPVRTW